ncbi:unnamed protein product [Arabis nemorensis]|uniref:F-box domain-containing protein n=1 Tax=Arabis nemorensis TaxID=586526 RepID=A0A565BKY3_9BRAS|nr:unnamed protein product [Arabis nemorensis]
MEPQKPSKRLRQVPCCENENPNPKSLPSVPGFNQNHLDLIISSFLSLPDLPSLPSSLSIESSFDRVFEKMFEASSDGSVQDRITVRSLELASILQDSTKKWFRKYATLFNTNSWPLYDDLTVKVFSMLDTKSLMQASASCTLFKKCAMDPLCYSHIDLTTRDVNETVVQRMISHAGKELRSLKVGRIACPYDRSRASLLSGSCFAPLYNNQGFKRDLLRSLHIYNSRWMKEKSLSGALIACPNLTDLKIVGLNFGQVNKVLDCLPRGCQNLFIEKEDNGYGESRFLYFPSFWRKWPNITSLSLIGFKIHDRDAYRLIMGLHKLKYMDVSRTYEIDGGFLRDVGYDCKDTLLETLILRDCSSLEKVSFKRAERKKTRSHICGSF